MHSEDESVTDASPVALTSRHVSRVPSPALLLGLAGLIPQLWAFAEVSLGDPEGRFTALASAFAYAALILSFLGGMWWGLLARARDADAAPIWLWIAAVMPSLLALASTVPWAVGAEWPGPSLVFLGLTLLASLTIDYRLVRNGVAPPWWMRLRVPLSIGLGGLTMAIGVMA